MSALAACAPLIPATAPPHIQHTPGAAVIVTDNRFDAGVLQLEYPRAWTVVKTSEAASERIQVYFVAPDGGLVFLRQVAADDQSSGETLNLPNGVVLKASVQAADEPSANFASQARQLLESVRGP